MIEALSRAIDFNLQRTEHTVAIRLLAVAWPVIEKQPLTPEAGSLFLAITLKLHEQLAGVHSRTEMVFYLRAIDEKLSRDCHQQWKAQRIDTSLSRMSQLKRLVLQDVHIQNPQPFPITIEPLNILVFLEALKHFHDVVNSYTELTPPAEKDHDSFLMQQIENRFLIQSIQQTLVNRFRSEEHTSELQSQSN